MIDVRFHGFYLWERNSEYVQGGERVGEDGCNISRPFIISRTAL